MNIKGLGYFIEKDRHRLGIITESVVNCLTFFKGCRLQMAFILHTTLYSIINYICTMDSMFWCSLMEM